MCIKTCTLPHADIIITLDHLVINSESEIDAGRRIGRQQLELGGRGKKDEAIIQTSSESSFIRESQSLVKLSRRRVRLLPSQTLVAVSCYLLLNRLEPPGLVA